MEATILERSSSENPAAISGSGALCYSATSLAGANRLFGLRVENSLEQNSEFRAAHSGACKAEIAPKLGLSDLVTK